MILVDRSISIANTIVQLLDILDLCCDCFVQSRFDGRWPVVRIEIKRVYEQPAPTDGTRILVDRLWPRGLSKERAQLDIWLKDIAPSTKLRKWFSHDPNKWIEFQAKYRHELKSKDDLLALVREKAAKGPVSLLYGAKDEDHNEAAVLQELLHAH